MRLRDLAGRQQRWKSNIGMTRDEPGIRKSRWPSPPGAANNLKIIQMIWNHINHFLNSAAEPVTSVRQSVCRRQTISPKNCVSFPKAAGERTEGCRIWPGSSSSGCRTLGCPGIRTRRWRCPTTDPPNNLRNDFNDFKSFKSFLKLFARQGRIIYKIFWLICSTRPNKL